MSDEVKVLTDEELAEFKAAPIDAYKVLTVWPRLLATLSERTRERDEAMRQARAWQMNADKYLAENNGHKARALAAEAQVAGLKANQRTPGTVEACSACMFTKTEEWAVCMVTVCPIRGSAG